MDDAISRSIEDTMPLAGVGGNFRPAYVDAVTWAMAVHHDRRPRSIAEWRTKLLDGAGVR